MCIRDRHKINIMTVNNFFKLTFVFIVSIFLFTACQKENDLQEIVDNNETAAKSRNAESCYTLIFPVTILFPDGGRERIYNQIELNEFLEEWEDWYEGEGALSLRFPVTVQLPNGSRERIRNQRQWDALVCLLYTSPSPRDATLSRMPSSA